MYTGGFEVRWEDTDGGVRVLKLLGELDLSEAERVRNAIVMEGDDVKRVVVDTTEVTFIDSSGLSALIAGVERFGLNRFRLIPGRATERLLEISGTGDLFGM